MAKRITAAASAALVAMAAYGCALEVEGNKQGGDPWASMLSGGTGDPGAEVLTSDGQPVRAGEPGEGAAEDPGGPANGRCDLSGTFAVEFRYPAQWQETPSAGFEVPLASAGQGDLRVLALGVLVHEGEEVTGGLHPCGVELPEFASGSQMERYSLMVPGERFEADAMPVWAVEATAPCANPGCALLSDSAAAELGVRLQDPLGELSLAPGLGAGELLDWLDPDQDGRNGVAATFMEGASYARLPVDRFGGILARASHVRIGLRSVWGMRGSLLTCDNVEGPLAGRADALFEGCTVDGAECDGQQTDYLATNLPRFRNAGEPSYRMERLGENAECADVRALYP